MYNLIKIYNSVQILISTATHLLPKWSSCVDIIFTNQANTVVDYGVHPSLHPNCHHQIKPPDKQHF